MAQNRTMALHKDPVGEVGIDSMSRRHTRELSGTPRSVSLGGEAWGPSYKPGYDEEEGRFCRRYLPGRIRIERP